MACKCLIFQPIYLGRQNKPIASKNITELDFQWPLSSRTLTNIVTWERMLVLVPIAMLADFSPRYTLTVKQWLKQVIYYGSIRFSLSILLCTAFANLFFFCSTGHILLLLSLHCRILQVSHCSVCQCLSSLLKSLFCVVFFSAKRRPIQFSCWPAQKKNTISADKKEKRKKEK